LLGGFGLSSHVQNIVFLRQCYDWTIDQLDLAAPTIRTLFKTIAWLVAEYRFLVHGLFDLLPVNLPHGVIDLAFALLLSISISRILMRAELRRYDASIALSLLMAEVDWRRAQPGPATTSLEQAIISGRRWNSTLNLEALGVYLDGGFLGGEEDFFDSPVIRRTLSFCFLRAVISGSIFLLLATLYYIDHLYLYMR